MPSQQTADNPKEKLIKCEVIRAIGIKPTEEDIKKAKQRADQKGFAFTSKNMSTMIYPNKPVFDEKAKEWVPGEPVYAKLDKDTANKLSKVGAVRIVLE